MTPLMWLGVVAVAVGLALGGGSMAVVRRTAPTRERALRRQRIVQYCILGFLAAALAFDAIDTPRHRWLNAVVLVLMACGVTFDWVRGRRAKAG